MPSRPSRQERIQQDLDELLGQLATLAKALLIRNGEFFPFGATIGKRGKFTLVTPVPEGDRPTAHDVVDSVLSEVKSSQGSLRAYGVAAMAATTSDADAVRIELEHAEGSSLIIALPYARGDFGAFAYGDMEAHRAGRRIWPVEAPTRTRPSKSTARVKAKPKETTKATPKPGGTAKTRPPRESRPGPTGTGRRTAHTARKPLQTQVV